MIFTVFKKELKDTLRDRRTLMAMLVVPILIFPVIMSLFVTVSESFQKQAQEKTLKIGYVTHGNENEVLEQLKQLPASAGKMEFYPISSEKVARTKVEQDTLQAALVFDSQFNQQLENQQSGKITVLVNITKVGYQERLEACFKVIEKGLLAQRLSILKLNQEQIEPLKVDYQNTASMQETLGKFAGGILPYFFIIFGFIGCMYPAIDLFTGEKERGTIETLLVVPMERWKILFGKMGVVVLSGISAASFALLGLFVSFEGLDLVKDPELLAVIHSILSIKFILLLFVLLIPLIVFFAGVMVPIAVYAKTFKEAQSIITPLNMVVILPAMIGFFPGIELNAITACIPVVNIVLATKDLIAGTLNVWLLALSFVVMVCLASAAVIVSYRQFGKETNVIS